MTKYGDPYSEFVLCIWPIQSAHTHSSEQTPGAVGSQCGARGAVVVLKEERALYIHSLHWQFLPDLRLELATFRLRVQLSNH